MANTLGGLRSLKGLFGRLVSVSSVSSAPVKNNLDTPDVSTDLSQQTVKSKPAVIKKSSAKRSATIPVEPGSEVETLRSLLEENNRTALTGLLRLTGKSGKHLKTFLPLVDNLIGLMRSPNASPWIRMQAAAVLRVMAPYIKSHEDRYAIHDSAVTMQTLSIMAAKVEQSLSPDEPVDTVPYQMMAKRFKGLRGLYADGMPDSTPSLEGKDRLLS